MIRKFKDHKKRKDKIIKNPVSVLRLQSLRGGRDYDKHFLYMKPGSQPTHSAKLQRKTRI